MKYLIVGSGGTGGCIGAYLANAGKDVDFLARNKNLDAMLKNGFIVHTVHHGDIIINPVNAFDENEYSNKADVIFVCVKSYSIDSIIPLIKKASHQNTVIIPILNVFGIGDKLAPKIPELQVLDGCIYISAFISGHGEITQSGKIFRIVFGNRENSPVDDILLENIKNDLEESHIRVVVSDNIKRDTFKKYSFISSYASAGAYHDVISEEMHKEGESRETFKKLNEELKQVIVALDIKFDFDITLENLKVLDSMPKETTASMQKDMKLGNKDERDEIVFEILRLGEKYKLDLPMYKKIGEYFGYNH